MRQGIPWISRRFAHGLVWLAIGAWGCLGLKAASQDGRGPALAAEPSVTLHSIDLPHFEPAMPVAAGFNEFQVVCVSCHSPRYVLMQPPFSQRQWEESVDKMVKVYGAQMDSEQRKGIVDYLLAIRGPNGNAESQPKADDDSDFSSAPILAAPSDWAPTLRIATNDSERQKDLDRGAELFAQNCAGCHGPSGQGNGWISHVLLRKPKDLSSMRFSRQLLSQILWNGKRGTAMPSWRSLPQNDLAALTAFVQKLHVPPDDELATAEDRQRGSSIFAVNCAPCHGASGDGKGAVAMNLVPEPANFKLKQPNPEYIRRVLAEGIPGTAMPSWKEQIPEADRRVLAIHVRSLFEPNEQAGH